MAVKALDSIKLADAKRRIIVALDSTLEEALPIMRALSGEEWKARLGPRMIHRGEAREAIKQIEAYGGMPFLYNGDVGGTPGGMRQAATSITELGVRAFNVNANAGIEGMMAAREGAEEQAQIEEAKEAAHWIGSYDELRVPRRRPYIFADTVLTTIGEEEAFLSYGGPIRAKVLQYAREAKLAGLDGVICSAQEVDFLRPRKELAGLMYLTPGIRPEWMGQGPARAVTPRQAIKARSDFLIVGMPITHPQTGSALDSFLSIAEEVALSL
ncbi:MAG: orotidine 5'-phosphate decarboxylase / HUMPS family protein [Chloroflexota bacterium]